MMTCELTVAGTRLIAHAQRALYRPDTGTLMVADVHVGKGGVFRRAGIAVPSGDTDTDIGRLDALIQELEPRRLVILGDLAHGEATVESGWSGWKLNSSQKSNCGGVSFIQLRGASSIGIEKIQNIGMGCRVSGRPSVISAHSSSQQRFDLPCIAAAQQVSRSQAHAELAADTAGDGLQMRRQQAHRHEIRSLVVAILARFTEHAQIDVEDAPAGGRRCRNRANCTVPATFGCVRSEQDLPGAVAVRLAIGRER